MVELTNYSAVGRRKESVARVKLRSGKGEVRVNRRKFEDYFKRETDRLLIMRPLEITNTLNKFDVYVNVRGGGNTGQAGAMQLGISRALIEMDPGLKDALRKKGFLTRDPRMKERKKYGQKGARKRFQWTKR